jgi:thiol-disulfide isomerase/thioredoxin
MKIFRFYLIFLGVLTHNITCHAASIESDTSNMLIHVKNSNIRSANGAEFSKKSLVGKWIILDFWHQYCKGCINSFPRMNHLRQKYGKDIEVILVGMPYRDMKIRDVYDRCVKEMSLNMPIVYDSAFATKWGIVGTPDIFIFDPNGHFRYRTSSLTEQNITDILNGENPILYPDPGTLSRVRRSYNNKPLLISGNGGSEDDFLCRSIIARWTPLQPIFGISIKEGRFEVFGRTLKELYLIAYVGRYYWNSSDSSMYGIFSREVVLELKDSSMLMPQNQWSQSYSYSLTNPGITTYSRGRSEYANEFVRSVMQNDLQGYFPYDVSVEWRRMPCLMMKASNQFGKLFYKIDTVSSEDHSGVLLKNHPIAELISQLESTVKAPNVPIFDKTGIKGGVNINVNGIYFSQIEKELIKYGVFFEQDSIFMKTLVIRDRAKAMSQK